MKQKIAAQFANFWLQCPALAYGISYWIGIQYALTGKILYLCPLIFLYPPLWIKDRHKTVYTILTAIIGFIQVYTTYEFPKWKNEKILGYGIFHISSFGESSSRFGKLWRYKGFFKVFYNADGERIGINLPCTISFPQKFNKDPPIASSIYWIKGNLFRTEAGTWCLHPLNRSGWHPISSYWNIPYYRYLVKQKIVQYIYSKYPSIREREFLGGILTGKFTDQNIGFEFGRFGLQHLLAISGFHFSLIGSLLAAALSFFISKSRIPLFLLILLFGYFIFLGFSPSIARAWISITIALCGHLIGKNSFGLNSLGVALLAILAYDPYQAMKIGFQFSFLVTSGIVIFYPLFRKVFKRYAREYTFEEVVEMGIFGKLFLLFRNLFIDICILNLSVQLVAFPAMLIYFKEFPVMGFFYNLFFPFLVSISIFSLLLGLFFSLIPFLGNMIHSLNAIYTKKILDIVYECPSSADYMINITIPLEIWGLLIILILAAGIYLKNCNEEETLIFI